MKTYHAVLTSIVLPAALTIAMGGCGENDSTGSHAHGADTHEHAEDTHTHEDGSTHASHADADPIDEENHEHAEVPLPPAVIGDLTIELAQGHGGVAAGRESHLVVKLPYSDNGETIVRAWIGTEDRTLSFVGKGEYAPAHDDYDIHATAPSPLPENAMWWIEIVKPDGTRVLGSSTPIKE